MIPRAISLRNFRGFREAAIELKPLTVLLGPNSSGKSSFGQALAAMAHGQGLYGGGGQRATLSPTNDSEVWPVDLGRTSDLRTHGETGFVYIGFLTDAGFMELGFGGADENPDNLRINYFSYPTNPQVSIGIAAPSANMPRVIAGGHASIPSDANLLKMAPGDMAFRRLNESVWWDESAKVQTSVDLEGLVVRSVQHLGHTIVPLNNQPRDTIKSLLTNLGYLRAVRKRPSRSYKDDVGLRQAIGYEGEWTATVLQEQGPNQIVSRRPPPIPDNVETARKTQNEPWRENQSSLLEGVGWWLQQLGLATSVETARLPEDKRRLQIRVTLPHQRACDITEVGFGISQVLPVLVSGLMQPRDSVFVVDLPEAHLHPLPQARLADFFCSLALSDRLALVETHSEMFFHRLRLRAEMEPELKDKIQVYFIDQPKNGICCRPRPVGLGYDQELDWPVGFFQEGWETETQINVVRQAHGKSPHG